MKTRISRSYRSSTPRRARRIEGTWSLLLGLSWTIMVAGVSMAQRLTLDLPDEDFAFLAKMAAEFGAPREEIAAEWLAAAIQRAQEDPLLQQAGSIESPI